MLRAFLILGGALVLLLALAYLPPVQGFIKDKAVAVAGNSLGLTLDIQRMRIKFPLTLSLENATALSPQGDTLVYARKLDAGIRIFPLFRSNLKFHSAALAGAQLDYRDSLSGVNLRAKIGELDLRRASVGLKDSRVRIGAIVLDSSDVYIFTGTGTGNEKTDTTATAWRFETPAIELSGVNFRMETGDSTLSLALAISSGSLTGVDLNLADSYIHASSVRIDQGTGSYFYLPEGSPAVSNDPTPESDRSEPWVVRGEKVDLDGISFTYALKNHTPLPGFDVNYISADNIRLLADSIYNRGSDLRMGISRLSLAERSGIVIREAGGEITLDSSGITLADFSVVTAASQIKLDANYPTSGSPNGKVHAEVDAQVGYSDITAFVPGGSPVLTALAGRGAELRTDISGTVSDIAVNRLRLLVPGGADISASGSLRNITSGEISGDMGFNATLLSGRLAESFIADTTITRRLNIPDNLRLSGRVAFSPRFYAPDITVVADSGSLHLAGQINLSTEEYDGLLQTDNFPLSLFLPSDSLGLATMQLTAAGRRFDPLAEGMQANVSLLVDRFDFRGYPYSDINLDGSLGNSLLEAQLVSRSSALDVNLEIVGQVTNERYTFRIQGPVTHADIYGLGLSSAPLDVSGRMDAFGYIAPDTAYRADLILDSLRIVHSGKTETIPNATVNAYAGGTTVLARVRTGDLALDFHSYAGLDSLILGIDRTLLQVRRQIDSTDINMILLQDAMPPFSLRLTAGLDNPLNSLLRERGMSFSKLTMGARTDSTFRAGLIVNSYRTRNLTLDTLNIGLLRRGEQLNYYIRLANRPGNIEQLALIRVQGHLVDNTAEANFYQRNRADSVGFRFGLEAELADQAVTVHMTPENPVFGFIDWKVNPDNYIRYGYDRQIGADFRLEGDNQHLYVVSRPVDEGRQTAIDIDIAGIDIGQALSLLPNPVPADGYLGADMTVAMREGTTYLSGTLDLDSLYYSDSRIGDFGLQVDFLTDTAKWQLNSLQVAHDGTNVLSASGINSKRISDGLDASVSMSSFPLQAVNPFLPQDVITLGGHINGELELGGRPNDIIMDGTIAFTDATLTVPVTGTSFDISPNRISIEESVLSLPEFDITSADGSRMIIDGELDISDLSNIYSDLSVTATDFDIVNSRRSGGSQVYGKAVIDLDATARGEMNALVVRGDVALLGSTDVTYVLREEEGKVEENRQDFVRFVSFADTAALALLDSVPPLSSFGIDMLVNIDIQEQVKATLNISEDGNSRIELIGSGTLSYTLNTQGDGRFTGRYELSGGTVVYSPPVISAKTFAIEDGSNVTWTGDIANPTFNITARQSLRTTVSRDDLSSNVTFNVIVRVTQTLEDLSIVFDLEAPDDITLQNELSSLAPEQRSSQALGLLIYNTYTGPGSSARVDANNPLNSLLERELNQWARNSLSGVDLSFGVNSVDDAGGGQHTDYSYRVSKSLLDDRIKVTVGGSLNIDGSTEELAENFVDDISLEYRLNKRDNMFLKAYRYNTRESILEGEVTETGFGFVVRKKLNRLADLFRLRRAPEKKEARQLSREIREQSMQARKEADIEKYGLPEERSRRRQQDGTGDAEIKATEPEAAAGQTDRKSSHLQNPTR